MQFGVYINVKWTNISWLYCTVQDCIENGRDKMLVDPDPDEIYTKRKARFFECGTKWSCLSCHLKCEIPGRWMGITWKDAVFHESRNEPARGKFWNVNRKCRASLNSNQFKESKNISEGRVPKGNWGEQRPKVFLFESEVLSQFQEKWSSTWSSFYHVHRLRPSYTCQLFVQSWQSRIL